MTLDQYLRETQQKQETFAQVIGVTQAAVTRYVNGLRIPRPKVMARIIQATGGRVSASDFYPSAASDDHPATPPSAVSKPDAETSACPKTSLARAPKSLASATP